MLTQQQMKDAVAAQWTGSHRLMSTGDKRADAEFDACITRGKKVLETYTVTYSERYIRGCTPPTSANQIVVDAGHIAFNAAVRIATFEKRR